MCRFVVTMPDILGWGLAPLYAKIRLEIEDYRPDPQQFSGPFQPSREQYITCIHSAIFNLSFLGLEKDMAAIWS